jgi:hypothetical protein
MPLSKKVHTILWWFGIAFSIGMAIALLILGLRTM